MVIVFCIDDLVIQSITIWSLANGSSPIPIRSYSKQSLFNGLDKISLHFYSQIESGLKVIT